MILTAIRALRKGASVENPTPLKWAGVAVAAGLIALNVAQGYGYLAGVSETDWIDLILAALVIYSQIATTTKIGILPEPKLLRVDEVRANLGDPRLIDAEEMQRRIDAMGGIQAIVRGMSADAKRRYPGQTIDDFFDLDERAQEAIRATPPLDPVALSDRIRNGDLAGQRPGLPPQPVPPDRPGFWTDPQRGPFLD